MAGAKTSVSFEKIGSLEVGQISRFILWSNAQIMRCVNPTDGVNTTTLRLRYSFTLSVVGVERGACEAPPRSWSALKIGAACKAFAEKAVKRSCRGAERRGSGERRGPKGRADVGQSSC